MRRRAREAAAGAVGFEALAKAENDAASAAVKETGAVATAGTTSAVAGGEAAVGGAAQGVGSVIGGVNKLPGVAEEAADVAGKAGKFVSVEQEMATAGKGLTTLQRGAGVAATGLEAVGTVGAVAGTATTAIGGLETAAGVAGTGLEAAAAAGTTAGGGLAAAGGAAALLVNPFTLAAAGTVGVIAAFDKLTHWAEDKANSKNIQAGDNTNNARLDNINRGRVAKGLRKMTQAEFEATEAGDDEESNSLDDTIARTFVGQGATEEQKALVIRLNNEDRNARADAKKAAQEAAEKAKNRAPDAPSAAGISPGAMALAHAQGLVGEVASGDGGSSGGHSRVADLRNTVNPYDQQLYDLQAELRHSKGKANADRRAALQDQLAGVRRSSQEWRRQHADAMHAAREDEHGAKALQKSDEKAVRRSAELEDVRRDEDFAAKQEELEEQISDAKDAKDYARTNALQHQLNRLKIDRDYDSQVLKANAEADPDEREHILAIARERHAGALKRDQRAFDSASKSFGASNRNWGAMLERMRNGGSVNAGGYTINPYSGNQVIGGNAGASSVGGGPYNPIHSAGHVIDLSGETAGVRSVGLPNNTPFVTHANGNLAALQQLYRVAASGAQTGSYAPLDPTQMLQQAMSEGGSHHHHGKHEVKAKHHIHKHFSGETVITFDDIKLPKDPFSNAVRRLRP